MDLARRQDRLAKADLDLFIANYTPDVGALVRSAIASLRARLPGAIEFVYDNYNALVIGYGPTERPSDAILSIAAYPRYLNLYFLHGATLADPRHLLEGQGRRVRYIRLENAATLRAVGVRTLMTRAIAQSPRKFDTQQPVRTVIRAVSTKQRSRRPASGLPR